MENPQHTTDAPSTRYEEVAAKVMSLITGGTFRVGDRLPSVRQLCRHMQVSVSTVMEAYRLLEDQGRVEVRPQSGHYVCAYLQPMLPDEPARSQPGASPASCNVNDLMQMLLRDAENPALMGFGAAVPNVALLPIEKLHRAYLTVARREAETLSRYCVPPGYGRLRSQVATGD